MLKDIIRQKMLQFVRDVGSDDEIEKFYKKYESERFVLPVDARILSGIMQSISIRQGYLVEDILREIIKDDQRLVLHPFSGQMRTELVYMKASLSTIDRYISRQYKGLTKPLKRIYQAFLRSLQRIEADETRILVESGCYNVDVAFMVVETGEWHLFEVKFCDNHNYIQLLDIYRKLYTIYAGMLNTFDKLIWDKFIPHVYYFNDYAVTKNKYMPEEYIYRGASLFRNFFVTVTYNDILDCLKQVKNSQEMCDAISDLQQKVQKYVQQREITYNN
jgi:hypothetical protein